MIGHSSKEMPSETALQVAARCWRDPRTEKSIMDVELAYVFAEQVDKYIEALIWLSRSADFGSDEQAETNWLKIRQELL